MTRDTESTDLAVFGGTVDLTDTETLKRHMTETADIGARGDGVSFMSFSGKRGLYKIGIDGRGLEKDEPFLVAVPLFKIGWICWKNGSPAAKRMAGLREPQIPEPDREEFGPFTKDGDGWHRARSMYMRSMLNGEEVEFSISSKSGVAAIADLHQQVRQQMASSEAIWPVVVFGLEEFEAKGFKNFKPTIEVIKWLTREEILLWKGDFDPLTLLDEPEVAPAKPAPAQRSRRGL